jgi:hypothetical protein
MSVSLALPDPLHTHHASYPIFPTVILPALSLFAIISTGCTSAKGTVNAAWSLEAKCQAVVDWAEPFRQEHGLPPYGTNTVIANLYRDKFFVPVFGIPYDAAHEMELLQIHKTVLDRCQAAFLPKNDVLLGQLNQLSPLFRYGLHFNPHIAAVVAERRKLEQWMDEVIDYANHPQPIQEYVTELEQYVWIARRDLSVLRPSEQKQFLSLLETRLAAAEQLPLAPSQASTSSGSARKPSPFPLARTSRPENVVNRIRVFDSRSAQFRMPPEGFDYPQPFGSIHWTDADVKTAFQRIHQWMSTEGFSCLWSFRMSWQGMESIYQLDLSHEVRAVIECRGDCRGVRYKASMESQWPMAIDFFGRTHPLPVLEFQGQAAVQVEGYQQKRGLFGYQVVWRFSRPDPRRADPDIRISLWKRGTGSDKDACNFTP